MLKALVVLGLATAILFASKHQNPAVHAAGPGAPPPPTCPYKVCPGQ